MPRLSTILVLLDAFAVRADVRVRRGGVDVHNLVRVPRAPQSEASDVLDQLAASLQGGVLVLSDDVFLQSIELPPRAIAGLGARELEQALAYEAQTYSGLQATDTHIAWHRDGDERQFLVLQYGRTDFAAIEDAVTRAGGTLLGVAHPAGVPLPLATDAGERFVRVEAWDGVRADVRGGDSDVRVRVTRGDAPTGGDAPTEQLVVRAGAAPTGGTARRFDLTTDEGLVAWLETWALAIARADRRVVALQPAASPTVRNRRLLLAGVFTIGAVVAAVLDRTARQDDLHAASARLAATRAPLDRLVAKEAEIQSLTLQVEAAKTQPLPRPADASPWSAAVAVAALEALAAERPAGLVVDEVTLGWQRCQIRGRSRASRTVDELANGLAPRLALVGYDVLPGTRTQVDAGAGKLFEFTLDLVDAAAAAARAGIALPQPPAPLPEDVK